MSEDAARNVLAVPEFGTIRTLKPYAGFETVYAGQNVGTYALYLTENGKVLDDNAARGIAGYDPNLIPGVPVQMGTRILLWLPSIQANQLNGEPYSYIISWRLRNVFDHRVAQNARPPFHLPKQGLGVPDTTGPNPGVRVVLPAANQTVVYNETEPSLVCTPAQQTLRTEYVKACTTSVRLPLMPDGATGVVQQGILPSTTPGYTAPKFLVHEVQAVGDELIVALTRNIGTEAVWDFDGYDQLVALAFNSAVPDNGVLMTTGVSP
jgi:hypothetical protein